jgi:hypothetical protein
MSDGIRILTIPRHNPVNAFTMGGIARDAGLSVEQFKEAALKQAASSTTIPTDSSQSGLYGSCSQITGKWLRLVQLFTV